MLKTFMKGDTLNLPYKYNYINLTTDIGLPALVSDIPSLSTGSISVQVRFKIILSMPILGFEVGLELSSEI